MSRVIGSAMTVSIHAPRAGSDGLGTGATNLLARFNPRSPCGERHARFCHPFGRDWFQSTLPVRGATCCRRYPVHYSSVSIHAPRAGSDKEATILYSEGACFNPRSPCGERLPTLRGDYTLYGFQSTLPVRGATQHHMNHFGNWSVSIHAPRAGSDIFILSSPQLLRVSIHAPRAGSDKEEKCMYTTTTVSIHAPRAGSDIATLTTCTGMTVSIHAPRAGSD